MDFMKTKRLISFIMLILFVVLVSNIPAPTQLTLTCSKSIIETLKRGAKYVQI